MDLLEEDDWSFVVKTHALLEAGMAQLITHALGRAELDNFISRLPISSERSGKLALLKALKLLDARHRRFISALSVLRNFYVHSVGNIATPIADYIHNLDKTRRARFVRDCMLNAPDPVKIGNRKIPLHTFIQDNPKAHIWMSAMDLLGHIHLKRETQKIHADYAELAARFDEFPGVADNKK